MSADIFSVLDTETALRRLGGNKKLYVRLLDQFQANYGASVTDLIAQAAAGDIASAERGAHTLKGLAGNLGADALQRSSADAERALREGADKAAVDPCLARMSADLDETLVAVRAFLAAEAQNAPQ